jgi:hypothetical protein
MPAVLSHRKINQSGFQWRRRQANPAPAAPGRGDRGGDELDPGDAVGEARELDRAVDFRAAATAGADRLGDLAVERRERFEIALGWPAGRRVTRAAAAPAPLPERAIVCVGWPKGEKTSWFGCPWCHSMPPRLP